MTDKPEWTDDEIELAVNAVEAKFPTYPGVFRNMAREIAMAALSAVRRVPEGCWIAPDNPTLEMQDAIIDARLCEGYPSIDVCQSETSDSE